MPEIKNTFTQGKMNKDLDERIVPNGQYRDAMNIQVSTSEGSDVGTVQNILGNSIMNNRGEVIIPSGYECVGSIADEKNDTLYSFVTNDTNSAIVEYAKDGAASPVLVDLNQGVLNFSAGDIITGINIIDEFLLWTDGVSEPKKINIERCKSGSGTDLSTHTQLVVNGTNTGISITEEHITIVKKKPLRPLSVKINPALSTNKKPLFEKIFPRFSYRYRYEDGEYSAFAPFTDVVFNSEYPIDQNSSTLYDENTAYDTKEPYNSGMINMIESIELYDFVSSEMPKDVTQIDVLYKQENSSVVYVVEIIKNTDAEWSANGIGGQLSNYKGKFTIESENIYAAVPTNQLLRSWDNVPKTAKAQEITGNRIVYGNYTQGYDLTIASPKVIADYKLRHPSFELPYIEGGLPSVKSQRNYQLGVVYGDKYGRETPVFTSTDSSIVIPWEDIGSITPSGVNYPLASFSLQLKTYLDSAHPAGFDYYKFFIKETSGEYYNLVMGAMFNPTKSDLQTDDHVWISFASSDRNKISKDDYITFKKKTEISSQIADENKFRVLDVKNEAPDAIKYNYIVLGEVADTVSGVSGFLDTVFSNVEERPIITTLNTDPIKLEIDKTSWIDNGGNELVDPNKPHDLYFYFIKTDTGGADERSKKYKVAAIVQTGSGNTATYKIRLTESITTEDATIAEDGTTGNFDDNIVVKFEKKERKDLESFSGRFFVKILANNLIKDELEDIEGLDIDSAYNIVVKKKTFWHADTEDSGSTYDIESYLINNEGTGTQPITNSPDTVSGHTGNTVSSTITDWQAILDEMNTDNTRWFVDQMYMVAAQTGEYAKHATYGWRAGIPNDIGDTYGVEGGVGSVPGGYSSNVLNTTLGHEQLFPSTNTIKPTNPTTITSNDNLINGLEGIVTTTDHHVLASGRRRWKYIDWGEVSSSSSDSVSNYPSYNNITTPTGRYFIHLSYLAPGPDLHTGEFACDDEDLRLAPDGVLAGTNVDPDYQGNDLLHNNLQGIHGGGVFSSTDTTAGKTVFPEVLPTWDTLTSKNLHGGFNTTFQSKHDEQWEIPPGPDKDFAANFLPGSKFKFKEDPTTPPTIYRIISAPAPKKIYNHTPWRKMWKVNSVGTLVGMGNSVEEAATTWGNNTDGDGKNNAPGALALKDKLEEFGKANNRRLVHMLWIDIDPTDGSQNGGYNPFSGGTIMDSITPDDIEFIKEDFELTSGEISQNPAIWETEPKDNVDLDIYYEASQAYPITLTEENIELFAPIGCRVDFPDEPRAFSGDFEITSPVHVASWEGTDKVILDTPVNRYSGGNSINYTGGHPEGGAKIRFFKQDGSYTTAIVSNHASVAGASNIKWFTVQPTTETGLSWYNCFSFGNGIESDRIRDDFNGMTLTNGVRANATLDKPYEEEHRKSGLIYSGIYNSTSGVNNLNQFIAAEKITKDLNPTFGSIQKLFSRRISLIAFCEDRVIGITANKNALYNADGKPQLVATNAVLGDANPFVGDYGISKNPESFAKDSYRAYFTDKQRGAVLRLSMDGLTPISDAGMSDWFKDKFKKPDYNFIGSFDNYKNDYNLTIDGGTGITTLEERGDSYTLTYSEDVKGWVSFKSFIQESGVSMAGDYYTFKAGKCYKHNSNESRNTFYGIRKASTIKFLLNESPSVIKNFNTLNYDGDGLSTWNYTDEKYDFTGWFGSITTDQQNGTIIDFVEKEGKWFNYITGTAGAVLDTNAFNFQGIGVGFIQYSI